MLWSILAFLGGGALALQAGVNGTLAERVGSSLSAAFASFVVGTVALGTGMLATGAPVPTRALPISPWWAWTGGLCGAIYVASVTSSAPRLGAGATSALVIAGQIGFAVVLDHFGWAGLPQHALNAGRLAGVLLIFVGVLILRLL